MTVGTITQLAGRPEGARPVFHAPRKQRLTTKVQLLHPDAKLPSRAKSGDAGWDVYAVGGCEIPPGRTRKIPLGIALEPPTGYWYKAFTRSSTAAAEVSVDGGVLDSGYRGEVSILLYNHSRDPITILRGDRVAQFVEMRLPDCEMMPADSLSATDRGGGGFGSTGR
jgi:dUTP pyrophosphatase